eukprot:9210269-Pyramimonas_sp.AAC.1
MRLVENVLRSSDAVGRECASLRTAAWTVAPVRLKATADWAGASARCRSDEEAMSYRLSFDRVLFGP